MKPKALKLARKEPRQDRSRSTVEAIFIAVTRILDKDGAASLTTNKVAEVAGVSVGSLYQYFKNKESIYEGILLRLIEENLNRFEDILRKSNIEEIKIRHIIQTVVRTQFESFQKMEKVSTALFQYAPKVIPVSHFKKADERIIKFLLDQIHEHNIEIRPQNKEEAFFVCAQAVRSVMLMSFLNRTNEERETIINELIDMLSTYLEKSN